MTKLEKSVDFEVYSYGLYVFCLEKKCSLLTETILDSKTNLESKPETEFYLEKFFYDFLLEENLALEMKIEVAVIPEMEFSKITFAPLN